MPLWLRNWSAVSHARSLLSPRNRTPHWPRLTSSALTTVAAWLPRGPGVLGLLLLGQRLGPDRPDPVPDFDLQRTPFVSRDRLDGDGYVAICRAEDTACVEEARRLATGKTGTQFINFQTRNLYQGTPGKLGRFFIILVPPQPVVQVPR